MKRHPIALAIGLSAFAGLQPLHAQQLTIQRPLLEWASEIQVATPVAAPAVAAPAPVAVHLPEPRPTPKPAVAIVAAPPATPLRSSVAAAHDRPAQPQPQPQPLAPMPAAVVAVASPVRPLAAPVTVPAPSVPETPAAPAPAAPTLVNLTPASPPAGSGRVVTVLPKPAPSRLPPVAVPAAAPVLPAVVNVSRVTAPAHSPEPSAAVPLAPHPASPVLNAAAIAAVVRPPAAPEPVAPSPEPVTSTPVPVPEAPPAPTLVSLIPAGPPSQHSAVRSRTAAAVAPIRPPQPAVPSLPVAPLAAAPAKILPPVPVPEAPAEKQPAPPAPAAPLPSMVALVPAVPAPPRQAAVTAKVSAPAQPPVHDALNEKKPAQPVSAAPPLASVTPATPVAPPVPAVPVAPPVPVTAAAAVASAPPRQAAVPEKVLPPAPSLAASEPVAKAPASPAPAPSKTPPVRAPLNLALPPQLAAGSASPSVGSGSKLTMPLLNPLQSKIADAAGSRFTQWLTASEDTDGAELAPRMDQDTLRQVLYRAVEQAAQNSPQVRQTHAEYEAALADVDEAKGQRWPQLNVGTNSKAVALTGGRANNDSGAGVNLSLTTNVFDWGQNRKTIASREQLALATRQRYESELQTSAFTVSSNVVELAKNRLLVNISQQYVDRMGLLVSMLQEIVQVDRGRGSEVTQAKARLLQAESNRDSVAAKVDEFELNLRKLLGEGVIPSVPGRVWPLQSIPLDAMLATVNEHPAIKQAEAEADAADLNVAAIKASSKPALNWVVSKSTSRDTLGREQPVQTMLSINWAAFRGGSGRAQETAALQRAAASREKKGQQLLDLEYKVRTADQNARTFLARADLYHNLTAETDGVRKAFFEQWYHLGKRTLLDVLSAESDHYNNRVSEITSRFDGYQSIFQEYNGAGQLTAWLRGAPPQE